VNFFIDGIRNYFNFSGRVCRLEYWMFILFVAIFLFITIFLDNILGINKNGKGGVFELLYSIFIIIPIISISFRRINDVGKSPLWLCVFFFPVIGQIWYIILMCEE